ncbi:MAG: hypothetical protein DME35_09205, partial [Verrucomicrobia bacterium]
GSKNKTSLDDRNGTLLRIIGRLKPGMTAAVAKPALEGLAANLEKAYPVEQKNQTFITAPVSRIAVSTNPTAASGVKSIAPLLLGMAVVVLLVACLNLANMLLARGTARRKEIAIRLALGGSRWRIVRQLLSEGFVLALLGGVGGLILGLWSSDLLIGSMRKFMPFEIVWATGANPAILAATFGFCLLGTLMFALGPALKISRSAVIADLKAHAGEDVAQRRWKFLPRNPLVVVQIAFSLALLTAAALFVRGAGKAASVDSGLKPGASYLLEIDASLAGYEPKRAQELYQNLNARLAALPGVEHVSISATVPFGITSSDKNVQRAGVNRGVEAKPSTAAEGLAFKAAWNSVGANYFSTVGLPVLRGRAFTEAEATQPGPRVAIIDEPLAKKLWPDGDALGQRVQYAAENTPSGQRGGGAAGGTSAELSKEEKQDETIEIVGIVPVTRHDLFANEEPDGSIYLPFARGFQSDVSFFVRFRSLAPGSEASTADLLRRTVRDVDPAIPIISLQTFAQYLDSNLDLWLVRTGAGLFSIFGALALGLAVVGLYGVKAYSVARRTREIGIRMALGAQAGAVLRMIMGEGSIMLVSGVAIGLLLAIATAKILSGILYGVGAFDPIAFTVAPLVLITAALIATRLRNLERNYPLGHGKFFYVLRNIDIDVAEGEFVSVMGPSGAGKSTLLHILGMHDHGWSGEYFFNEAAVHHLKAKERAALRNEQIGFVFQQYHLLDDLTVYENLEIPLSYRKVGKSERSAIVADALDRFQMVAKKDLYPRQLSGGQQQLVGVARAIIASPKLILADEPTGNLHSSQGEEIMELFQKLNAEGTTIIQVTHSEKNAGYGNRIIQLRDGWVVEPNKK